MTPTVCFSPSLPVNSDLHFTIRGDGLGGCGLAEQGFANLWAAARATWGLTGGKYFYEVKVERNVDVDLPDTEEHPNALRCGEYVLGCEGVGVECVGRCENVWGWVCGSCT